MPELSARASHYLRDTTSKPIPPYHVLLSRHAQGLPELGLGEYTWARNFSENHARKIGRDWKEDGGELLDMMYDPRIRALLEKNKGLADSLHSVIHLIQLDTSDLPQADIWKGAAVAGLENAWKGNITLDEGVWQAALNMFCLDVYNGVIPSESRNGAFFVPPYEWESVQQRDLIERRIFDVMDLQIKGRADAHARMPSWLQEMRIKVIQNQLYQKYGFTPSLDHLYAYDHMPFIMAPFDRFDRFVQEDGSRGKTRREQDALFAGWLPFYSETDYYAHNFCKMQVPPSWIGWYSRFSENDYSGYIDSLVGTVEIGGKILSREEIILLKARHEWVHKYVNPFVGQVYSGNLNNWLCEGLVGALSEVAIHTKSIQESSGNLPGVTEIVSATPSASFYPLYTLLILALAEHKSTNGTLISGIQEMYSAVQAEADRLPKVSRMRGYHRFGHDQPGLRPVTSWNMKNDLLPVRSKNLKSFFLCLFLRKRQKQLKRVCAVWLFVFQSMLSR